MLAKDERAAAARGEGCLGKAADDEPVFVIRAQDILAPVLVELWVSLATLHNARNEKLTGAAKLAWLMREWQKANPEKVKWPD